jgi:23S rRNA pseudouridine2605 synthase
MEPEQSMRRIGLARAISKLGYCSRSRAVGLISEGRVSLNRNVTRNPETPVRLEQDHITVDDKPVVAAEKIYLLMNKPRGVVTTSSDEKNRGTVYTVLNAKSPARDKNLPSDCPPWVAPVGRLDKASEGLLLLTNDSEWAARIAAPETHLDKTYHVQVSTVGDDEFVRSLTRGVVTTDGELLRAKQARRLRAGQKNCWLEIVLDQGKNRQIRRMIEGMGVGVLRLVRVAIGPLQLGELAKGECRALSEDEKRMLDRALREITL